jgi:prophage regulatory protein
MIILRLPEVKRVLGHRADASVYNAIRAGLFTNGVAIGQRAKGWPDYEAQSIATARVAGKSDEEIRELVKLLHAKRNEIPILVSEVEWRGLK